MDKSWTQRIRNLEAWSRDIIPEFPGNDFDAEVVNFAEYIQDSLKIISEFNSHFVIFEPLLWVNEPDWLLTDDQWRNL
jgi:hypothetical protein